MQIKLKCQARKSVSSNDLCNASAVMIISGSSINFPVCQRHLANIKKLPLVATLKNRDAIIDEKLFVHEN